jgi:hypothetical protein
MVSVLDVTAAREAEQQHADRLREKDDRLRDDAILLK